MPKMMNDRTFEICFLSRCEGAQIDSKERLEEICQICPDGIVVRRPTIFTKRSGDRIINGGLHGFPNDGSFQKAAQAGLDR